jgi:D-alanyl-D-alanine carboxypeptidase/D-alanyl-D-alanine-endopeptidase (penicillin-binding protein 4)
VPAEARAVGVLPSPTLAEVVRDINKFSNNVMARQLFLTLGMESGKRPAGAADADAALRAWLDARGLAMPELVLENGSGLSRRERISAEGLGRVLQAAWRSAVMPELIASLPVTATDGTMRKRLKQNGVAGQAHIKTGSLEGVRSIAGYVLDKTGRRWIVVFFVNHAHASGAQAAQDALLQWVYERGAG